MNMKKHKQSLRLRFIFDNFVLFRIFPRRIKFSTPIKQKFTSGSNKLLRAYKVTQNIDG